MFPQVDVTGERFIGPDVGFNNPSDIVGGEVHKAFGHGNIACLISIGNGRLIKNQLADHGWMTKLKGFFQYFISGRPNQLHPMENLAKDCENVHERLARCLNLKERYFRFNLGVDEKLWNVEDWTPFNKELVLQRVGRTESQTSSDVGIKEDTEAA